MKKNKLEKMIQDLGKYLKTDKAAAALDLLRSELENYEEAKKPKATGSSADFETPQEIVGKSNALALFSDGACRGNPGPGSYAFIIQNPNGDVVGKGAEAFSHTTNNKMELSGVIEGVKSIKDDLSPFDELYIFTDSKYVVDGMKSWVAGWKKRGWKKADRKTPENVELWKSLDELSTICHMNFLWVKGHAGHPQNEFVDQLANEVLDESGF